METRGEEDVENGNSVPHVRRVVDIESGILGAPPARMKTSDIVWSRRSAIRSSDYLNLSEVQQNALAEGLRKWDAAYRYHATLATASGEPAGSGVCVSSGGRRGILTARHVLYADGQKEARESNLIIAFAPPQGEMVRRRLQRGQRDNGEPLGPFRVTGISIGDRLTVTPLQREGKVCLDPGLPDIAIIAVSDDIEERIRKAARAEGTVIPEPQWVDLDKEERVSIPYGAMNEDDEMLMGNWLITGLRGERSDVKKLYSETDVMEVDRIYRRGEYEYYGIFVDEAGGTRAAFRGWKGASGGGVWQQRLTPFGRRKIEQFSPPPLTPEDFETPVLGGIAFYHETRKTLQELRGDRDDTFYRGELYAHRIGGVLLDIIRRALRDGVKHGSSAFEAVT